VARRGLRSVRIGSLNRHILDSQKVVKGICHPLKRLKPLSLKNFMLRDILADFFSLDGKLFASSEFLNESHF
jgi:hypothetical protein